LTVDPGVSESLPEIRPVVDELPPTLVEAASWRRGADVAALPGSKVLKLHPGGGQYDVLSVQPDGQQAPTAVFHINRPGSLHTVEAPHVSDEPPRRP